uniref:CRAL-TRIO domain-containing protein n=1 Tax=Craspedostauros australis TaxID=1486917 RepID=A0A7R9ZJH3_9STRA|mmetsp:Transcript_10737/g.29610  ORF Transcript_10737/g.29610 Transcript_10737/m.29610 type:complete len:274 (+) Transcript_10737:166-987(+)|eukprot:CAMPEP_0198116868 /NCGR_PEP_ID=MMETSP1442-20131203/15099_1 /TAXON_ID= /ORGANISM="Craspedostauros australis, Strain CCMP3328" /LENGTH=273 /DNA_ID=CAMNT_0043774795 /DNA_START=130 /DNA_END=951 /DNA_ORIENTATION=-
MCGPTTKTDDATSVPYEKSEAFQLITYTEEELEAMRKVKAALMEEHGVEESRIGLCFLAMNTINSKLRVEEATKKYKKLLDIMADCGVPEGIDDDLWKPEAAYQLYPYKPAGVDNNGLSVLWIKGGNKVPLDEERHHVQAALMFFMAVHADHKSLKNGITFVIDSSQKPEGPKIGNEKKMQKIYQSFPLRPQAIRIAGASGVMRVIINTTIKVASVFTKQKILDRIQFVTIEDAKKAMPAHSVPKYVGGEGGGHSTIEEWVKGRLSLFTKPEL